MTHSNVTVSKWDVSALLEPGEQSLERGFEEMSFGAGCQLWSHMCAQGMGGGRKGGELLAEWSVRCYLFGVSFCLRRNSSGSRCAARGRAADEVLAGG